MSTARLRTVRIAGAVALVGLLVGCTSADGDAGGGTASPAPPSTASEGSTEEATRAPEEVAAAVFESFEDPEPLGEAEGEMKTGGGPVPGRLTVEAAVANAHSTQVRFTLYSTGPEEASLSLDALNTVSPLATDIRSVTITDPATETVYTPYLGYREPGALADAPFCICSNHPKTVDADGVTLDATFPALPDGTETVAVNVPGFPDVEVAVTRAAPRQEG